MTIKKPMGISAIIEQHLQNYFAAHEGNLPSNGLYDLIMAEIERPLLITTLKAVSGNQKRAAEILGINRNTLRKKILELEIDLKECLIM
ncbi:MAG: hypothetical protein HYS39_01710 [Proteobacteria bacterium]|nr:hypothetical protein [Pseudomonadota bacterium]